MNFFKEISFVEIFSKHSISYSEPENFNHKDKHLFYDENFSFEIPAVQLFELRQALVNNRSVTHNYIPFFKLTLHKKPSFIQLCKDLVRLSLQKKEYQAIGILGVQEWSNNYFHWMTEVLPRIVLMNQKNPNVPVLIPSNYLLYNFIHQSLDRLKISFKIFDLKTALKVKILFAIPVQHVGRINEGLLKTFRDSFISPFNEYSKPHRLLYISRDKANRRKVINEFEVLSYLESKGFEKVILEDYTLDEQMELMKQSKLVISCHGAGLTNIMFMQKSQTVIELKSKNNNYWCYFSLARVFGLDYNYILCEGDNENHRDANIKVDLHELSELLEKNLHSNNLQ